MRGIRNEFDATHLLPRSLTANFRTKKSELLNAVSLPGFFTQPAVVACVTGLIIPVVLFCLLKSKAGEKWLMFMYHCFIRDGVFYS